MQGPADGSDDGWPDDRDDAAEAEGIGAVPHDAARTWVHPSEVGMVQRGRTDRRRGTALAGALVVGGLGLLVMGVLIGFGWGTDDAPSADSSPMDALSPSLASLTVVRGSDHRTVTGVVLDDDGHVAVRAAAVLGADQLWATCGGRPPQQVQVVASDGPSDVAVVRLPMAGGREAVDGPAPRDGQSVLVVRAGAGEAEPSSQGALVTAPDVHLLRADGTVTEALFRTTSAAARATGPSTVTVATTSLVQTSTDPAPSDPSATDGAVFDARGRFLGLVVALTDGNQDVMPARTVQEVAHSLLESGRVVRSWIGVTSVDAPLDATHPTGGGALVTTIRTGAPAARAGLRVGDVVVGLGDADVRTMVDLGAALHDLDVGTTTPIAIVRDGVRRTVSITTTAGPATMTTPTTTAPLP